MIELHNYFVGIPSPYHPPESARLGGKVKNHPKFPDDQIVFPSLPLSDFNPVTRTFRAGSGKVYKLINVAPDYAEQFENAEERILKIFE